SAVLKGLGTLPAELRKAIGQAANTIKTELEGLLETRRQELRASEQATALEHERLDVTLPGRTHPRGHLHPLSQVARDVVRAMEGMALHLYDGPEGETHYYNFQALNTPPDHPARNMQDTFGVVPGQVLLPTQPPPMQTRVREHMRPPVRAVVIGKV